MLLILKLSSRMQHGKLAFEMFHLFAHHRQVQLNVVLMIADDSQKVKFELIQHLNTHRHAKCFTALLQVHLGELVSDIHPPTNTIPTVLQQNPYRSTISTTCYYHTSI